MSNSQGNRMSEASAIFPIVHAIIPKWHIIKNPCDSMIIISVPIVTAFVVEGHSYL